MKKITILLKKAQEGDAESQCSLADCYCYGDGIVRDYEKAMHWYMQAAKQGHTFAMYSIGGMYLDGFVGSDEVGFINSEKAVEWFMKAAELGDNESALLLAEMYQLGDGVIQDYEKALYWYSKSAELGDTRIKLLLDMYHYGKEGLKKMVLRNLSIPMYSI